MAHSTCRPIITMRLTRGHGKKAKRLANKAVRRASVVADGKAYRKLSETYDIIDYRHTISAIEMAENPDFYRKFTRK